MARRKKSELRSSEEETTGSLQSQEGKIVEEKENRIVEEKENRKTTNAGTKRSRKKPAGTSSELVEKVAVVEAIPQIVAGEPEQSPVVAPTGESKSQKPRGRGRISKAGSRESNPKSEIQNPKLEKPAPQAKATLADLFAEAADAKPKSEVRDTQSDERVSETPTPAQILSRLIEDITVSRPGEEPLPAAETKSPRKRAPRRTKTQQQTETLSPQEAPLDKAGTTDDTVLEESAQQAKPRRGTGRKRKPVVAAETAETEQEPESLPSKPEPRTRKPKTRSPKKEIEKEDALPPYISRHPMARVHFQHGVPYISLGEQRMRPFFFFGNAQTSDAEERVFKQIMQAARAGVNLYSLLLTLRIDESGATETLGAIRYWIRLVQDVNPDAYFVWRIVPVPGRDWQQRFPEAVPRFADGTVGQPSVCSDKWWQAAEKVIFDLVRAVEESDEGERVLGYHLDRGEWFYSESSGYDTSTSALELFREWLRRRYSQDVIALRAAWHDGSAGFNNVTIPALTPHSRPDEYHFYEARRGGRWIDYHQFLSEATAERILTLARCIKQASGGRCLCGTSYGYLFEWGHPYSGHFALGKLIRSEDIHFISAPPTYADRLPGGTGAPALPIDSVRLHHKLFLSEEDYATPFGVMSETDDYNPPIKSSEAVEQVQLRGIGSSLTFATGANWMDLWGNGWLDDASVWQRAAEYERYWKWRTLVGQTEPEIAVLVDEASFCYVKPRSPLIRSLLTQSREALLRCGASVGFYLLDDVLRRDFPHAKLIIFLNAWNLSQPVREAIRSRLHGEGRTLLWLYAASLFDGHRETLKTARDVMGIALEPQPWASRQGTQLLTKLHPITSGIEENQLGTKERWEPSFYALSDEATALGEYIETGLPSIALKEHEDWRAVFIGERVLTPEILRGVCIYAGVHVWNYQNDLTHVRPPWVHIHAKKAGTRVLTFPERCSVYDLQAGEIVAENTHQHRLFMQEGESKLLIAAPVAALNALLKGEKWLPKTFVEIVPLEVEKEQDVHTERWDASKIEDYENEPEPSYPSEQPYSSEQSEPSETRNPKRSRRKRKSKPALETESKQELDTGDGLDIRVEWRR